MSRFANRWAGLAFISVAVSLIIVDTTVVNVAVPSIVDDIGISSTQVQWVQESYTLVFAALLLVFGAVADRFGRRRLLCAGVVLFLLASLLAAAAPTGLLLIGARVVQGVGGAMVLPTTLSLINATFRGNERGIAFAVWGSTIGGVVALGPLLGGYLTTYFSWRWAFGINLPIGLIVVVGVVLFVAESRDPASAGPIDVVGAVLSVLASGSLVFGLIEGRTYGWWATDASSAPALGDWVWPLALSPVPLSFALTVVSGGVFIWWELRRQRSGKAPLLALSLFSIRSFRNGNIAATIVSLGEFGIILSLPLWLQNVIGYTALQTGLVLLGLALGSFFASGISAAFAERVTPLFLVRMGLVAEIVGVAGLGSVISAESSWIIVTPFLFVYGIGLGLATAQLTGVVLKDVPVAQSGQGSGTTSTARQIGSALGIAVLGTVLFTSAGTSLQNRFADVDILPKQAQSAVTDAVVESAGAAIPDISKKNGGVGKLAEAAFSDGTRYSAFAAAGFLTLGLIASLRLTARSEDTSNDVDSRQGREAQ